MLAGISIRTFKGREIVIYYISSNNLSRYRILVHSDMNDEDQKYGIPELKKFPMPDEKHVRSAIKFFNYVTPAHEKQLATAILKRMREYGMSFDDFEVGEENRFSKYIPKHLEHHGIKGQRWGIRRFQEKDGSLTSAGKRRYGSETPSSFNANPLYRPGKVERTTTVIKDVRSKPSNKQKYSHKPNKDELDKWLKENFIGFSVRPEYLQKEIDYINTYSDYDGLTNGERMMMDDEEYELFQKMSYEEQQKYLRELRARQMAYIDKNVTIDNYNTDHEDGRYSIIDKLREQLTGRLDTDNVSAVRNRIVEDRRGYLVATNKWSENEEALAATRWTQERLDRAVTNMQNNTIRKRAENFVRKLLRK